MFGLLKSKISGFIKGLAGREEKKAEEALPQPILQPQPTAQPKPILIEEKKPAEFVQDQPKEEKKIHADQPKKQEVQEQPKPFPVAEKKPAAEGKKSEAGQKKPAVGEKAGQETPEFEPTKTEEKVAQKKFEEKMPVIEQKKSIFDSVASVFVPKKHVAPGAQPEAKPIEAKKPEIVKGQPAQRPLEIKPGLAKVQPAAKAPEAIKPEAARELAPTPPGQKKPEITTAQPVPKTPEMAKGQFQPKKPEMDISDLGRRAQSGKREMAPKIGIGTAIKSFFSGEITIGESEVADLLEELEISLLEADVAYDVSLEVSSQLRSRLVGMKVPKGEVEERTRDAVRHVLASVMDSDRKFVLVERVRSIQKPVKILFVGPNGAGKTTTMAKIARMLMDSGLTVVFSASDTFRAAAIAQTEVHGGKLGVKTIKIRYGADPASVAFDAINFAKANGIDVVLIDSAGRQDTNANLLSELKKISRVASPDIKLYVGESIGGNSVIEQINAFNAAIGMDGAILTKIDCDAKGGTAISIAKSTGIPVLFLGVGQGYNDLIPFDPQKIAQEIMT